VTSEKDYVLLTYFYSLRQHNGQSGGSKISIPVQVFSIPVQVYSAESKLFADLAVCH